MIPVLSVLGVLAVSLIVTRVAALALVHTGLSSEAARFQARSAFTGVGFTTGESEKVVNHPVRRRILMMLMLLGNAGIISLISTFIVAFLSLEKSEQGTPLSLRIGLLVAGLAGLWWAARSRWVDRRLSALIRWALRRYSTLDVSDYAALLHLTGEYRVSELQVEPNDWLVNKKLSDCLLRKEGINVLAVARADGEYEGSPTGETTIGVGDNLIVYGREGALQRLDHRRQGRKGDREHQGAIEEQRELAEQAQARGPSS